MTDRLCLLVCRNFLPELTAAAQEVSTLSEGEKVRLLGRAYVTIKEGWELVGDPARLQESAEAMDLILLGIGEDGHTASIFPGQDELLTCDKLVAASVNPHTKQDRVTLTGKSLLAANKLIFIATGASPTEVLTAPVTAETIEPEATMTAAYDDAYQRYRRLYPAISAAC